MGGRIFQAETALSSIYTQSVLCWASLSFEMFFFFSVCGILAFFRGNSSQCGDSETED